MSSKKIMKWLKFSPPEEEPQFEVEDGMIVQREPTGTGLSPDNFKLWEVVTNFYITKEVAEAMEFTEGVELIKVVTPYRALVGVGRLFKVSETKKKMVENVNEVVHECSSGESVEKQD